MPVIGQASFIAQPTTDKYLSLLNEEYTRTIDLTGIGTNWTKIRVSVNCAFANTGGGNITQGQFFMGLSCGTAKPYGAQLTTHAIGYIWGTAESLGTYTYNAGAGNPYYTNGSLYGVRKVGVVVNTWTVGGGSFVFPATGGALERRGWVSMQVEKRNATEALVYAFTEVAATAASDVYYSQFLYTSNQGGNTTQTCLNTTVASNNQIVTGISSWATNPLDTVDIYWAHTIYPLRIYAVACSITGP